MKKISKIIYSMISFLYNSNTNKMKYYLWIKLFGILQRKDKHTGELLPQRKER